MQVIEDKAKTNVHIDGLKWVMKEDGIQVVLVFWKLFLKHVVPKSNFKINEKIQICPHPNLTIAKCFYLD